MIIIIKPMHVAPFNRLNDCCVSKDCQACNGKFPFFESQYQSLLPFDAIRRTPYLYGVEKRSFVKVGKWRVKGLLSAWVSSQHSLCSKAAVTKKESNSSVQFYMRRVMCVVSRISQRYSIRTVATKV
jgi:hypothetical protein